MDGGHGGETRQNCCNPWHGADRPLLVRLGKFLQDNGMKLVHVNPHHVKKSKELDDNNPNKNDRKAPKTIATLVNEGRFSYSYIPTGIYAEIRSLSNLRFQTQEGLTRIKNRIARWFSIYFLNIKTFMGI